MSSFYTYILASQRNGTLYIGSTNDLARRVHEHREKVTKGFTSEYGVSRLVYFETYETPEAAVARERQLKKWNRVWKIELIEKDSPEWNDYYDQINM
jgi:putative endonuclease